MLRRSAAAVRERERERERGRERRKWRLGIGKHLCARKRKGGRNLRPLLTRVARWTCAKEMIFAINGYNLVPCGQRKYLKSTSSSKLLGSILLDLL